MKKILIADDHSDIRKLIRITIGNAFEVLEAEDGMTALQIARHQKPALVVLDIMMPGEMDGLQVLDAIRADATLVDTQVIMVTARGQAKDYEMGMSRGANAYLIKPFSPIQLVNSIKELVKGTWWRQPRPPPARPSDWPVRRATPRCTISFIATPRTCRNCWRTTTSWNSAIAP